MILLIKVVSPQDGPVPSEVVKVVHDDGHKEVENEERGHHEEGGEVHVGDVTATAIRVSSLIAALEIRNYILEIRN